ncbi:MAG: aldo/keto reductase [Planctomycetota bacterium]
MQARRLGRSGIEVSALGLGCWAIGGPAWKQGRPVGWGKIDDAESVRAIKHAIDIGVTLFDTADIYGCGHSERILGRAISGQRDKVVIATKFGKMFDEHSKQALEWNASGKYIHQACEASLKRLNSDYIDLYQFHLDTDENTLEVRDTMEELVAEGKIRCYGWSTDNPGQAKIFAKGRYCAAIQQSLNIFGGNLKTLGVCEEFNLASINCSPLAKGILTGKFTENSALPADDLRSSWDFKNGRPAEMLRQLSAIRDIITSNGRSCAQGALCWLWALSKKTIPIPGFKTVEQVEENAAAMEFGPFTQKQMKQIDELLKKKG